MNRKTLLWIALAVALLLILGSCVALLARGGSGTGTTISDVDREDCDRQDALRGERGECSAAQIRRAREDEARRKASARPTRVSVSKAPTRRAEAPAPRRTTKKRK